MPITAFIFYSYIIMLSLLLLVLLITDNLAQSNDRKCSLTCGRSCDISEVISVVKSNDTVCLTLMSYTLGDVAMVTDVSNVTVMGIGRIVTISCGVGVGMVISNVDQLWMENITFEGCSLTGEKWEQNVVPLIEQLVVFFVDSPSVLEFLPSVVGKSLTVIGSCNINLCRVNVQNANGVGLLALNMIGDSSLRDCVFDSITDFGCTEGSSDPQCIAGGAMIFIGDIAAGYTIPNNNTIIIDNCIFQNSVSHSDYLSLELSNGIFRLNVSLGNKSVNPLDGSAGLSVLMARHHKDTSQQVVIMNSQ